MMSDILLLPDRKVAKLDKRLVMNIIETIVLISYAVSTALLLYLWKSDARFKYKILYSLLLLIPVLGPIAYPWIRHWPSPAPPHLVKESPSRMYAPFVEREIARRDQIQSVYDAGDEILQAERLRKQRKHESRRRRRRYFDRPPKSD